MDCSTPGLPDPWTAACQASLSFTIFWRLVKIVSFESMMPPTILFFDVPFSSCLQSFPASRSFFFFKVFSNELSLCIRWPNYWSFTFSISPSNEYSGLISFRIDWFDLLAVQGTLKSLLQYHSSKASILRQSTLLNSPTLTFIHDYWKNHSFD